MPYNQEHMFFQWSGHFVSASNEVLDEFVGGLRFVGPGLAAADNDDILEALAATMANFWKAPQARITDGALLDSFKWNRIGVDGRYADSNNTRWFTPAATINGGGASPHPTQIACCTTWTTDFQRGRASKGRTYWPSGHVVDRASKFKLGEGVPQQMANWGINLIRALNQTTETGTAVPAPGPSGQVPVVASNLNAAVMSDIGSGRSSLITGCRVGDRLDVQRRRANRQPEIYSTSSF